MKFIYVVCGVSFGCRVWGRLNLLFYYLKSWNIVVESAIWNNAPFGTLDSWELSVNCFHDNIFTVKLWVGVPYLMELAIFVDSSGHRCLILHECRHTDMLLRLLWVSDWSHYRTCQHFYLLLWSLGLFYWLLWSQMCRYVFVDCCRCRVWQAHTSPISTPVATPALSSRTTRVGYGHPYPPPTPKHSARSVAYTCVFIVCS